MESTQDPFGLQRFVEAQEGVYARACAELRNGRKTSHWMWFIFPQIQGLGRTSTSTKYAIRSLDEARAYLNHPILGARLRECTQILNGVQGRSADEIFGYPDTLKFRSCMTLFAQVSNGGSAFHQALQTYFEGVPDPRTLELLQD
jgi:uncharacterized protein (DUF1810 family)